MVEVFFDERKKIDYKKKERKRVKQEYYHKMKII